MLSFTPHQLYLERKRRYFLPLPKLNKVQLEILSERLTELGYKLRAGWRIKASTSSSVLWLESRGVAYSASDLLDPISPIIPKLLEVRKEPTTSQSLFEMYYATRREGNSIRVRLDPRIESLSFWRELRLADEPGLTPDEALVLKVLLRKAKGSVRAIADYPNETSREMQIQRRVYFDSLLEVDEFTSNLRILGSRNRRNTYLPRNCMIDLPDFQLPREGELRNLAEELGEWCYYQIST